MKPTEKSECYPIFEPNQVLSDVHLNRVCEYLDEQERLTRANLIGIGIVCGLEIGLKKFQAGDALINLSKGCGITSEGYLIVEPADQKLAAYREYVLPNGVEYPQFKDSSVPQVQYPLWELSPAGEPDTTPLGTPSDFLSDKAVLLFLELKKEGLRNCSPNNCDDKGSKMAATLRRLLIRRTDLEKIIAAGNDLASGLTSADIEKALSARLNLPDLRLPRYDVPKTGPVSTKQILSAFLAVFNKHKMAKETGGALSSAYAAFTPLLQEEYPTDPFMGFSDKFGFLDSVPKTSAQVRFLQYYYDFFDDLIMAYNEFRWKGMELMCVCCPPESLFPRHLMLGVLDTASVNSPGVYRRQFLASSAINRCGEQAKELKVLFRRMVEMVAAFTNFPFSKSAVESKIDDQVRITPSKLGNVPVSDKAIPYYYRQDGTPPLYRLWDPEKTRLGRANQNMSYRSDEYDPSAPKFITDPLSYDLEPHNFLRIEGHLGNNYQNVLKVLLSLKDRYRLPIEIIALRTGVFDENMPVDLSKETCRFHDLEALYDVQREELLTTLGEGTMYLYDIPITGPKLEGGTPKHPLLKKYAPNFLYKAGTVGAWYEKFLSLIQSRPYIDVDQNKIDNEVFKVYCVLFAGTEVPDAKYYAHIVSIYYFTKLAEVLPASLDNLGYADFENKCQDLIGLVRFFRSDAANKISEEFKPFIPQEDLIDHFDHVLFSCKLEPVKAINEEYENRIRRIKQKQFLSFFLRNNPGIQHKAGVPMGGTFIVVYHDANSILSGKPGKTHVALKESTAVKFSAANVESATKGVSAALLRMQSKTEMLKDPDFKFIFENLTGQVLSPAPFVGGESVDKIFNEAVNGLVDGTVIADFFLPYICCSDCSTVQFVLPKTPPTFTVKIGCTSSDNLAEITIEPKGGEGPYSYKLDDLYFQALTGKLLLSAGAHTIVIRDSAGMESAAQSLAIPKVLTIGAEKYVDDLSAKSYQVTFDISGGTLPYKSESGTVANNTFFTSVSVPSGDKISVTITDSVGCKTTKDFVHKAEPLCTLPCDGIALRRGYRFSLPVAGDNLLIKDLRFKFEHSEGKMIDLTKEVAVIIKKATGGVEFNEKFAKQMNEIIAKQAASSDWLKFYYSPQELQLGLDTWEIEYFKCLKFEFHITWSSQVAANAAQTSDITVNPDGSIIKVMEGEKILADITIPAFDGTKIDKCNPQKPVEKLCSKQPDMTLKISKNVDPEKRTAILDVTPSGNDKPAAYLWEVQDGIPAMSNKRQANFIFRQLKPAAKNVRLTAYTQNGCRVIATDNIVLGIIGVSKSRVEKSVGAKKSPKKPGRKR